MLHHLEDDDEDVFVSGLLEKYSARPPRLEHWFRALFASWYRPDYRQTQTTDFQPDVLQNVISTVGENPVYDVTDAPSSLKLELPATTVKMVKRTKQAVIRYHKFSEYKQPESYYHSQLILFIPWRNEEHDLLGDHETYFDSHSDCEETVNSNRSYIQKYEQLMNEAIEHNDEQPVNAWDAIASETQHEQYDCEKEGAQVDPNHAILLPADHSSYATLQMAQGNKSVPLAIDTQPTLLPFCDYA